MSDREIKILSIDDILPNRFQPRIQFDEQAINELSESIKAHGVIQPIVVRAVSDKYEIIAGERRYKATVLAGLSTIPALIVNLDDKESAEIALIENVQRQNLTPIEEAVSYKKILDMGYINQIELGQKLGKNQSTIANKLRLLNLTDEVQDALMENKISERHARSLLRLEKDDQVKMLNRVIDERLTVRRLDEEIEKVLNGEERGNNMENENILKEMGIPTEPIVEETPVVAAPTTEVPVVEAPIVEEQQQVEQVTETPSMENVTFDIPAIEEIEPAAPMAEPVSESINPGFMDVDKIEATAEDVYEEAPAPADIDMLLDTSNNPKMDDEPVSPFQPVENAALMKEAATEEENNTAADNDVPAPVPGGGKFFTMFAREEDTNPNFVKDIESEQVNMDFKEEPVEPSFNFGAPSQTPATPAVEQIEPVERPEELNPSSVLSMAQTLPREEEQLEETNDFTQTFQPDTLNDEDAFDKIQREEPESPFDNAMPKMQPITFDDMGEIEVKLPEAEKTTVDLKTVINTIRECAAKIEGFGFTVDNDEIDLPDSYQVTFKIDKN